ncbi:type IV pilus biogenesis/stability protein PilW [Rhodocyclaceae bacterium]
MKQGLRFWLVGTVALLAGCNTTLPRPDTSEQANVELAVSRQISDSKEQQRAKVHTDLGRLYLLDGRYEVALEEAKIALEADGGYAPAYNLRALVYMALNKNELAEENFHRALGLARNDPEINNDYGWFLCQTGRPKASTAHFQVAISNPLFRQPIKPLTNAGLCLLLVQQDRQAEDRQAENFFLRALRIDPKHTDALFWLADIAYRGKRFEEAQLRLKELHKIIEPVSHSAWLALRLARKMGDRDEEARMMGIMRRKYRDTPEYQSLSRGEFD